jgi:hypothetical protein
MGLAQFGLAPQIVFGDDRLFQSVPHDKFFTGKSRRSDSLRTIPTLRSRHRRGRSLFSVLHVFVLQFMDRYDQLAEGKWPNGIFAVLETSDGALGNSGLARTAHIPIPY